MNQFNAIGLIVVCVLTACTREEAPRVELDHVFIVVTPPAVDEIAALRSAGLTVQSEPSRHEGQGTASVSVLFENAYLELIWVDSSVAVDAEHAKTLQWFRNAEAWRTNGRSPFGFRLRRLPGDTAALPVPVERETAPWLAPGTAYELLHQPSDSLAFDFFVVPANNALPNWIGRVRERRPEELHHQGGGREITRVRAHGAAGNEPVAFRVLRPRPIETLRAPEPVLEIYLDGGVRGQRADLRPVLPLVLVR